MIIFPTLRFATRRTFTRLKNHRHLAPLTHYRYLSSAPVESIHCVKTYDRNKLSGPHGSYMEQYHLSLNEPEVFWRKAAEKIDWYKEPQTILQRPSAVDKPHEYRWFPDGIMNTCHNCLDVHIEQGRGNTLALIYDSPVTNVKKAFTYYELLDKVATFAAGLSEKGVVAGDRVVIYMPMIPEYVEIIVYSCDHSCTTNYLC